MATPQHPAFSVKYHPSVAEFSVSKASYLAARPDASFCYIATSALVVNTSAGFAPRVLILQRAASDEDPEKWEPPGGACDDEDSSILSAAARELWEEAGLEVDQICGQAGDPHFFTLDAGGRVCQFNFVVRVKSEGETLPTVKLSPEEHQQHVWATEAEIESREANGVTLEFTREEVRRTLLGAFKFIRTETS